MEEALAGLRVSRMLDGYRGKPAGDRQAVVRAVMAIAEYTLANADRLLELDVNPLLVMPNGVLAVDALILLAETD